RTCRSTEWAIRLWLTFFISTTAWAGNSEQDVIRYGSLMHPLALNQGALHRGPFAKARVVIFASLSPLKPFAKGCVLRGQGHSEGKVIVQRFPSNQLNLFWI